MLQGILIILAFVIIVALMMTKKIPTLLALPLMAVVTLDCWCSSNWCKR